MCGLAAYGKIRIIMQRRLEEVEEEITRHVVCTPGTCSGDPRLDDTRLTCNHIVSAIAYAGVAGMRRTYSWPVFNAATLTGRVTYCAERQCVDDRPTNFCEHCLLDARRLEDEDDDESAAVWKFAQAILRRGVMTPGGVSAAQMKAIDAEYDADDQATRAIWRELKLSSPSEP